MTHKVLNKGQTRNVNTLIKTQIDLWHTEYSIYTKQGA